MTRKKRPSNRKYKLWALERLSYCDSLQDILIFLASIDNRKIELLLCKKTSDNKNYFNTELERLGALNYFAHQVKFLFIQKSLLEQEKLIDPKFRESYRYKARFKIRPKDLPNIKGYELLQKLGYYNKDTNLRGVVMDHRYSIKDGIANNIEPKILGSLFNCEFMTHKDNLTKSSMSSISLNELLSAQQKIVLDIMP